MSRRPVLRAPVTLALVAVLAALAASGGVDAAAATAPTSTSVAPACDRDVPPGVMTCFALRRTDAGVARPMVMSPATSPAGYGPSSLQSAYGTVSASATGGTGRRVFVVDAYDDPTAEADLAVYRAQYGLPACTTANGCFAKIDQRSDAGPLPAADGGWAAEESLDLDMVSAICPNCSITLVEADSADGSDLYAAVELATALGAKYVSMSWGGAEYSGETADDTQVFAPGGVVYTASTGDNGYGVSYPAASPRVIAVGGTHLVAAAGTRGWDETAWSGAGSGCSVVEPKPDWQQTAVPDSVCAGRAVADVSADADPATGVAVYATSTTYPGWGVYGGTSASAPMIAAMAALAGPPAAASAPVGTMYGHAASFVDVTSGSNGLCLPLPLCTAGAGWDGPTGLGAPTGPAVFDTGPVTAPDPVPPATPTLSITAPRAWTTNAGWATSLQLAAIDARQQPVTWSASGLPGGLAIDPATGRIAGTPRAAGRSTVTVHAADRLGGNATATFTWTVAPNPCVPNAVSNAGFETGLARWSSSAVAVPTRRSSAHSGIRHAVLGGTGTAHLSTLAQTITVPAGCAATLAWWVRIASNDHTGRVHDTLTVTVDGRTVATASNRDASARWARRTITLPGTARRTLTIRFAARENRGLATAFNLDDVVLALRH
ncbi:MAG: putative Ig domain-containing protein [Jatrophihabitans sp.]|uniref:putative Ig domain-containing protein n=1 Tax=Jatrophihabitans sp. TaxID=1932789 RepID=UPI003F80DA79